MPSASITGNLQAKPSAEDFAHSRLISYACYQWPGYRSAPHHRLIARKLEAVERGEITRLMITMPPRHGKSMLASEFFPAWYLGRNPDHYVVSAAYAQELADDFGRKVKNQIEDTAYAAIFPGVSLAGDSRAAKRFHIQDWTGGYEHSLKQNGAFYAVGVGGPLTGRGAHLLLIDDPVKNREEADSELIRKKTKDWYTSTAYTRLMPGGRIVIIQCMTGDALITLADGAQKRLDAITTDDLVLSWDGKKHVGSSVSAIIDNGNCQTYLIRTKGTAVRANARHPFLVLTDEGLRWIRTKDLRSGMRIVSHHTAQTQERPALRRGVGSLQNAVACARRTTTRQSGHRDIAPLPSTAKDVCLTVANGGTELIRRILTACSLPRMGFALSASQMAVKVDRSIGSPISFPTITTKQGRFAASYATTATGSRDEIEIPRSWSAPSNTCGPDTDEVLSVQPFGNERVYDLAVDGTHNFVANGLWTHNTRWHEDDLSGWLIAEHQHEGWEVLDLPAIDTEGKPLWPEQYDLPALEKIKKAIGPRDWSALYQQRPTPEEGDYFKAEWFKPVAKLPDPKTLRVYGGSDYAVTADGGDYTVHIVVGVDPEERIYILDLWRKQAASDAWVEAFCDLVLDHKPMGWAEEQGQIKSGVGPFLNKRQRERKAWCAREQFPTRGDKAVRAQSIRGRAAANGIYYQADAPWWPDLRSELLSFPAGKHDDQVDALGLVGQLLDRMLKGEKLRPTEKPKRDKYARDDDDGDTVNWKIA